MRRWIQGHPDLADALFAAVLVFFGLSAVFGVPVEGAEPHGWRTAAANVVLLGCLAWRRRAPHAVMFVVTAATLAIWFDGSIDGPTAVAGTVALYGLGRYGKQPLAVRIYVSISAFLVVAAAGFALAESDTEHWLRFLSRCGIILGPFWLGDSQRARLELTATYKERAEKAEADRVIEARRATLDERNRIARELHDVVGHSVSVMVVQAVAAERLMAVDADRSREAIGHVAQVGRSALGEMRRILGMLDDGTDGLPFTPQPDLTDITGLIDKTRLAGLNVTLTTAGAPPDQLSPGIGLCLYRLVQESLTNVIKHAGVATAKVTLSFDDEARVEVVDDGRGAASDERSRAAGRGLVGMRERVLAHGGEFFAGPKPGGGYSVRANIPLDVAETQR